MKCSSLFFLPGLCLSPLLECILLEGRSCFSLVRCAMPRTGPGIQEVLRKHLLTGRRNNKSRSPWRGNLRVCTGHAEESGLAEAKSTMVRGLQKEVMCVAS